MRPLADRIRDCEERSARALIVANMLSEKGQTRSAELYFDRSAQWLMKANDLRETGRIQHV